ncbi:unnamed protein product [Boreogadus saida]
MKGVWQSLHQDDQCKHCLRSPWQQHQQQLSVKSEEDLLCAIGGASGAPPGRRLASTSFWRSIREENRELLQGGEKGQQREELETGTLGAWRPAVVN